MSKEQLMKISALSIGILLLMFSWYADGCLNNYRNKKNKYISPSQYDSLVKKAPRNVNHFVTNYFSHIEFKAQILEKRGGRTMDEHRQTLEEWYIVKQTSAFRSDINTSTYIYNIYDFSKPDSSLIYYFPQDGEAEVEIGDEIQKSIGTDYYLVVLKRTGDSVKLYMKKDMDFFWPDRYPYK